MATSSKSILNICLSKFNSHVTSACVLDIRTILSIRGNGCMCGRAGGVRIMRMHDCDFCESNRIESKDTHKTQNKLNEFNKEIPSERRRG